jgi:hypothetical protein
MVSGTMAHKAEILPPGKIRLFTVGWGQALMLKIWGIQQAQTKPGGWERISYDVRAGNPGLLFIMP